MRAESRIGSEASALSKLARPKRSATRSRDGWELLVEMMRCNRPNLMVRGHRPRSGGQILYSTECDGFAAIRELENDGVKVRSSAGREPAGSP